MADELTRHYPGFNIYLFFVERNQDTIYHKLITRRIRLTLIPKAVMKETFFLFPLM